MKKLLVYISIIIFICISAFNCVIPNPKPEECHVQTETIISIKEGSTFDIVFSDTHRDH